MPVYEYRCTDCEKLFEYEQRMSDPKKTECEACGGALERLISATSFHLKGGGWYKDLYSTPAAPKPTAPSAGESSAGESSAGDSSASDSGSADSSSKSSDSSGSSDSSSSSGGSSGSSGSSSAGGD